MNRSRKERAWAMPVLVAVVLLVSTSVLAQNNNKKSSSPPPPPAHSAPPPAHNAPPPAAHNTPNAQHTNGAPGAGGPNATHGNNTMQAKPGMSNGAKTGVGANNNNGHGTGAGTNAGHGTNNAHGTNGPGGANAHGAENAHNANAAHGANAAHRGPPTTTREIKTKSGATLHASFRGGKVRTIEAHNMKIEHGMHGERRIVTEHNGRRIVSMGRGRGYAERPYFNRGGRAYVQRTYYVGGRRYAYAYRGYYYHGARYYGYAPAYYYHPVYYGWAYNPWPQPVYYQWGYYNQPWYGSYNYYYQPYPAYPTASLWLTDYMVAEALRAAFEAQQNAKALPVPYRFAQSQSLSASLWSADPLVAGTLESVYSGTDVFAAFAGGTAAPAKLTPELKQELADEVKQQIADEKSAAENTQQTTAASGDEAPPALNPKFKIFMVASALDVTTDAGDECALSAGDVIERTGTDIDSDNNVAVVVKSSKKDECAVGATAAVDANDLQEMHNHFRETLDTGLKSLADSSGKDGLPKAPDTGTTAGEVPAPQPDASVDNDLSQQQKDADQTEAEVQQDSGNQ